MGAIVRNGEIYGSNMAINDAQTSANTTWSSEKVSDEIDARIKSVRYTIPAGTGTNNFAYPTGFNNSNCILIGVKIHTKYDSWVHETYNYPEINYWGDVSFKNDHFQYTPNYDGNATEIIFAFARI